MLEFFDENFIVYCVEGFLKVNKDATVNNEILIKKLQHFGIRGNICDWFASYIKHRNQFVSVLGFNSPKITIMHGVPQ
jgi:hypothetical protein